MVGALPRAEPRAAQFVRLDEVRLSLPFRRQLAQHIDASPLPSCPVSSILSLIDSMDRLGLAAVVYPTWNQPPLRVGDTGGDPYDGNNSPLVAPHTGAPAITVPMGFVGA